MRFSDKLIRCEIGEQIGLPFFFDVTKSAGLPSRVFLAKAPCPQTLSFIGA